MTSAQGFKHKVPVSQSVSSVAAPQLHFTFRARGGERREERNRRNYKSDISSYLNIGSVGSLATVATVPRPGTSLLGLTSSSCCWNQITSEWSPSALWSASDRLVDLEMFKYKLIKSLVKRSLLYSIVSIVQSSSLYFAALNSTSAVIKNLLLDIRRRKCKKEINK